MGFQFNQVGGGTKTRRPIALRLQYRAGLTEPRWYLTAEDGVERSVNLAELQNYIERENKRLERDQLHNFDPREINVRMEYQHCPNMILIDTPGLIAAPSVVGVDESSSSRSQQLALEQAAKEAERLVIEKLQCPDYIILCVEDTSDWKHGATREVVQKADPDLSRTVIVNTKLDTKLPQFGTAGDAADFVQASILDRLAPHKLGGPFFTSVPSGRVGRSTYDTEDFSYDSDADFVRACAMAESNDSSEIERRIRRIGNVDVKSRVGLSTLRKFLEEQVDVCYRRNVQKILPMLHADHQDAEQRLKACEYELQALSPETLKAGADTFCDNFCKCLRKAIQGSITAPVRLFGETLQQEYTAVGSFHAIKGSPMAVSVRTWDKLLESEVGNTGHRLYGGSQYHRALREFHLATSCLRMPVISEDEIANAAGLGEAHDGVNFLHASCVIAVEKARQSFDPVLDMLEARMVHIMDRLCPVAEYMMQEQKDRTAGSRKEKHRKGLDVSQNPHFRELVRSIFQNFVRQNSNAALLKCRDDLAAITKYVTWNLNDRGTGALTRGLPDQTNIISVYKVALEASNATSTKKKKRTAVPSGGATHHSAVALQRENDREYRNLLHLLEETFVARDPTRTSLVVSGLVQHIVGQWCVQFCTSVITKFNCYFMMPFVDDFHQHIRDEIQDLVEKGGDLAQFFDVVATRRSLENTRDELLNECRANKELQKKFQACTEAMMVK